MQTKPANWDALLSDNNNSFEFKAVINGNDYLFADIWSANISFPMMDKLTIGMACAASLDMTFMPKGDIPTGAKVQCYLRVANTSPLVLVTADDGTPVMTDDGYYLASSYPSYSGWLPFGTFYIDTRSKSPNGRLSITAYDAMMMTEQDYIDNSGSYPMQMSSAVNFICSTLGLQLDSRSQIAPYTIDSPTGVYKIREVLAGIAAASGGNAVITKDGKLLVKRLASPSSVSETPVVNCDLLSENTVTVGKVTLYPDSDTQYSSGTSGYEIQADCIYATQEICDYVKNLLSGVTYLPFSASSAYIDPALELGDSVKVNGNLSVLASVNYTVGPAMTANIEAPIDTEINHEYPYQSRSREERRTAYSFTQITKTTQQIKLELQSEIDDTNAAITISEQGIRSDFSTALNNLSSSIEQDMDGIRQTVNGKVDGSDVQTAIDLNLNALSLSYTAGTNGASITLSKDGVSITGNVQLGSIDASLINVENLNADNITAGELSADYIRLGGDMTVYRSTGSNVAGGSIGYTSGSYGGNGIHMMAEYGEVLATADGAAMYAGQDSQVAVSQSNVLLQSGDLGVELTHTAFIPLSQFPLGYSTHPWSTVYAASGTIQTSDRNKKKYINYNLDKYDSLFDRLKAATYKFRGTGKRTHVGMISQDVEDALAESGLTSEDFAGFVKTPRLDEKTGEVTSEDYALRYDEFIGLLIDQVQKLKKRVEELEGR